MKCAECGASLQGPKTHDGLGLLMECEACAYFVSDCRCREKLGYTPLRHVHCLNCDSMFKATVDTTKAGWRGLRV